MLRLDAMTYSSDAPNSDADQFFGAANDDLQIPPAHSLHMGLAALKQHDYEKAIAHLEAVCQSALDEATHLKAQMGLIKAYEQTGDVKLAIALCRPLCQHSSERVKQWGQQTLAALEHPPRPASSTESTSQTPADQQGARPGDRPGNKTGFVPLGPNATDSSQRIQLPPVFNSPTRLQPDEVMFPPAPAPMASDTEAAVDQELAPATPTDGDDALEFPVDGRPEVFQTEAVESSPAIATPLLQRVQWRNMGRSQKWNPILAEKGQSVEFWAIQGLTAIALVAVLRGLMWGAVFVGHGLRNFYTTLVDGQQHVMPRPPYLWVIVPVIVVLLLGAPWIMTLLLRWTYGMRSLSLEQFSPEGLRVIKRLSNRTRLPRPMLMTLPTEAPIMFCYGHLPRTTRLVMSTGLLNQLSDEELASLVASEMSHVMQRTVPLMTLLALVMQFPYLLYLKSAALADRIAIPVVIWPLQALSVVSYGVYWMLRWPGFWLSRYRLRGSDRATVNETGNPNAFARALTKVSLGMADATQRQTDPLLESFDLLMPVSYRSALALSSITSLDDLEAVLNWELQNPHRRWLSLNQTHLPLGDRLFSLSRIAQRWQVEPEYQLSMPVKPRLQAGPLLRQAAPFLGFPGGMAVAFGLWMVGLVATWLRFAPLEWLWGDRSLLWGLAFIGSSIGTILRVNAMFPDITRHTSTVNPALFTLLTQAAQLPLVGRPVQLQGELLGRSGNSNLLEQDLLLKTPTGTIKLHYLSPLGAIGNLIPQSGAPHRFVQRTVTLTGWFRRGATPWIDVDRLQAQGSPSVRSGHPIWSTLAAGAIALIGVMIIFRGWA